MIQPIGGFEHEEIGKAFGYDLERYVPVMIVAIGKKAKEQDTHHLECQLIV